jgi:hypothetical protein
VNFESFLKTFDKIEPLSNFQIIDQCKKFKIKHFKGVFMRNELVNENASKNECFTLNLDHSNNTGTHWTCVFVKSGTCYYFDSFGFPPPKEVEDYLHKFDKRYYNSFEIQKINQVICGHFCIYVLAKLNRGNDFYEILDELYNQQSCSDLLGQ